MEDIKILEQCPKCGEHLTLMTSIRVTTELSGSEWIVKRCLKCGGYPCTEVVMLNKNVYPQNDTCDDCQCFNCKSKSECDTCKECSYNYESNKVTKPYCNLKEE